MTGVEIRDWYESLGESRAWVAEYCGVTVRTVESCEQGVRQPGGSQTEYKERLRDLELRATSRGFGGWAETNWDSLPDERRKQCEEDREAELACDDRNYRGGDKLTPNATVRDDLMRLPGIGEVLSTGSSKAVFTSKLRIC
ncbi:MAG: helix-turn-helix domain-containing protein [Verrucomicrobiales bacterium]